jgi:hypothetical protein
VYNIPSGVISNPIVAPNKIRVINPSGTNSSVQDKPIGKIKRAKKNNPSLIITAKKTFNDPAIIIDSSGKLIFESSGKYFLISPIGIFKDLAKIVHNSVEVSTNAG